MIDAPRLEGWIAIPDAADLLGVSYQAVHKMTQSGALVGHVRRISLPDGEAVRDERRVVLVVEEAVVRALVTEKQDAVRTTEELLAG